MLEGVWFIIWGILWAVYFMLDGFDLGVGLLLPFLGKSDSEKSVLLSSIAPFWDGNEVWLITAGGVTFAAFPGAYAAIFSAFYTPLIVILFALMARAAGLEFRGKCRSPFARKACDCALFFGSLLTAVLFGVAFANIFRGIPIDGDGVFQGTIFTFLNLYGLAGGILFLLLFLHHGSLWLVVRSAAAVRERAIKASKTIWVFLALWAVLFLVLTRFHTGLYANYVLMPLLFLIPLVAVGALLLSRWFAARSAWWKAWTASACLIVFCTLFGVVGLYPHLLPSTLDRAFSLTVHNSASSPLTLKIMLIVALIFVPIVIVYQTIVYRIFAGSAITGDESDMEEY